MRKLNKKKYNYFYKITNNINNHFYYGIHSTDNLDDGYMGSGSRLNYAYKKYGIENFTKEILKFFNTRKECSEYESEIVTEDLVYNDECYNVSCGGDVVNTIGTVPVKDCNGNTFRCSKFNNEYINGELIPLNRDNVLVFVKETNTWRMVHIDEYHLNKEKYIAGIHSVRVKYKNDLDEKYFLITEDEYRKNRDLYTHNKNGFILSKNKKNENFFVHKDDERFTNGELVPIWKDRKHKKESLIKQKETFNKIGHQQGEKNSQYGTCWITKDGINKKIKKEYLNIFTQKGWVKGRVCKQKTQTT